MATFLDCYADQPQHFYLNLDMIEQVDPSNSAVYAISGECYTLTDEDMQKVIAFAREREYGYTS